MGTLDGRKILLVHPHATNDIKPLFQEKLQPQIVCLDKHFARTNFKEVNNEIAQAVASLEPVNAEI